MDFLHHDLLEYIPNVRFLAISLHLTDPPLSSCMGLVTNSAGLYAMRFCLGMFEVSNKIFRVQPLSKFVINVSF